MYDLKVSGGSLVDGSGGPAYTADVAVKDGVIVAIGVDLEGTAAEVIDARGRIVTPGFVDIHTHYDGQMTWDEVLEPSASHGVTTIVAGNCGVGFAPVRRGGEESLVELMEGVEDIPGTALYEGISWNWESFPEFLDEVGRLRHSMDVATYMAHGPLRTYVMGDRGAANEAATQEDTAMMAKLVREAIEAGALGFSSSRTKSHRTKRGEVVPGTYAADDELTAIAAAMMRAGGGHLEVIPAEFESGHENLLAELDLLGRVVRRTGVSASFPMEQVPKNPGMWRRQLEWSTRAVADGLDIHPQVGVRPLGMLMGLPSYHAFQLRPTYVALADRLSFPELLEELRKPAVRHQVLGEQDLPVDRTKQFSGLAKLMQSMPESLYVLGDPPDYEPTHEQSVAAVAEKRGVDPLEVQYDLLVQESGDAFLLMPSLNYVDENHDALLEMLEHPTSVIGLADGGAHCRMICDASYPTYLLTHWARDRHRGRRMSVEAVVRMQAADTAGLVGLNDRGTLAIGKRGDLNVIDFPNLKLHAPHHSDDLPAGGRRILQDASGYDATIVAGVVVRRNDRDTGARPGRLVRGPQGR